MLSKGPWRWLLLLACTAAAAAIPWAGGWVRPVFESRCTLSYMGKAKEMEQALKPVLTILFQAAPGVRMERSPQKGAGLVLTAEGDRPALAAASATRAAEAVIRNSLERRKRAARVRREAVQRHRDDLSRELKALAQDRPVTDRHAPTAASRKATAEKIRELETRRQLLIERFPRHTDIPALTKQIEALKKQSRGPVKKDTARRGELNKKMAEIRLQLGMIDQRVAEMMKAEEKQKPAWKVTVPASLPRRPLRVEKWPWSAAAGGVAFLVCFFFTRRRSRGRSGSAMDGLWRPASPAVVAAPATPLAALDEPAALYERWLGLAKTLYTPAAAPPADTLEVADPLLRETVDFLSQDRDALTRYMAGRISPGDLPTHVTSTVLMAIMGASEAGASDEQRKGLALAALFHDLAMVPRKGRAWLRIGPEVGRLSAPLIHQIPNLPPELLEMVQTMLIDMDQPARLEAWQNLSRPGNLQSFAKYLASIDRFDKVAQRQRTRLARRTAIRQLKSA